MVQLKFWITFILIFVASLVLTVFTGCGKTTSKSTEKFPLRQLVKTSTTTKFASGSYFLIGGTYSQGEYVSTNVKMFAKVKGAYRLVDIPIDNLRIVVDNNVKLPYLIIRYENYVDLKDDVLIDRVPYSNEYVPYLYCSEDLLPERLLPIKL